MDEMNKERAKALGLAGLLSRWSEWGSEKWVSELLAVEEEVRAQRSLERRIADAKLGAFKPMADFDWNWPAKIDRALVEELFKLEFVSEAANVILLGPNGVGKTMIAQNLAYQALLRGHSARFVTASHLLNELNACESAAALNRALKRWAGVGVLVIDEIGYLSYDNRHADLLFEVITRRYQQKPTILTTNRPFAEWNEVFPSAACVVTLIDRLVHRAEIVTVEGDSFRKKEAQERRASKARARGKKKEEREIPPLTE